MAVLQSIIDDLCDTLKRFLPGMTAVFIVMLLLRGFSGSVEAIKLQMSTLATSFLGAGEGMTGVLLHTLPLAISAAVATFAIARRIIRFESQVSILALAMIIIAGASVGGCLRGFAPEPEPSLQTPVATSAATKRHLELARAGNNIAIGIPSIETPTGLATVTKRPVTLPAQEGTESPIQRLQRIDWLAQPDLSKAPPRQIEPLALLPSASGIPGVAAVAINQLLAYLVAYQPRLFLAAIVAGGWIGWSWHCRLNRIAELAEERRDGEDQEQTELRRAA